MSGDQVASFIFLGLWAVALTGTFLASNRLGWNKTLQQAAIWVLIFLGAIAAFALWEDIERGLNPSVARIGETGAIEVPQYPDGHYYLTLNVNDQPIDFMVDTGATDIVLRREDAVAAGIDVGDLRFVGSAMTANGEVRTAPVRLQSISLGPIEDRDVFAVVNEGDMQDSLLGMGYLQRFGRIEIENGLLRLSR